MTRALINDDLVHVEKIALESVAPGFSFVSRFAEAMRLGSVALDSEGEFFLGVFEHATLIALGGITPDPYINDATVGRVRHVYVTAGVRRRGVGRQLLAALELRASSVYSTLRLRTDTADAARFYEALGFAPTTEPGATHRKR